MFRLYSIVACILTTSNADIVILFKEGERLARKNAAVISGHQTLGKKVQYHATVIIENNKLKEVGLK